MNGEQRKDNQNINHYCSFGGERLKFCKKNNNQK